MNVNLKIIISWISTILLLFIGINLVLRKPDYKFKTTLTVTSVTSRNVNGNHFDKKTITNTTFPLIIYDIYGTVPECGKKELKLVGLSENVKVGDTLSVWALPNCENGQAQAVTETLNVNDVPDGMPATLSGKYMSLARSLDNLGNPIKFSADVIGIFNKPVSQMEQLLGTGNTKLAGIIIIVVSIGMILLHTRK